MIERNWEKFCRRDCATFIFGLRCVSIGAIATFTAGMQTALQSIVHIIRYARRSGTIARLKCMNVSGELIQPARRRTATLIRLVAG